MFQVGPEGAIALAAALKVNPVLSYLNLSGTSIGGCVCTGFTHESWVTSHDLEVITVTGLVLPSLLLGRPETAKAGPPNILAASMQDTHHWNNVRMLAHCGRQQPLFNMM